MTLWDFIIDCTQVVFSTIYRGASGYWASPWYVLELAIAIGATTYWEWDWGADIITGGHDTIIIVVSKTPIDRRWPEFDNLHYTWGPALTLYLRLYERKKGGWGENGKANVCVRMRRFRRKAKN